MEQYAIVHFVLKKEDRNYAFLAQVGAPYQEAIDVLNQFISEIEALKAAALEVEAQQKAEQEKAAEAPA